jgi:hypothetical protein
MQLLLVLVLRLQLQPVLSLSPASRVQPRLPSLLMVGARLLLQQPQQPRLQQPQVLSPKMQPQPVPQRQLENLQLMFRRPRAEVLLVLLLLPRLVPP